MKKKKGKKIEKDLKIKKELKSEKARIYNGLKTISLTSGAGKSGQPLVNE